MADDGPVVVPCWLGQQLGGVLFAWVVGVPARVLIGGGGVSGATVWVCFFMALAATIGTLASSGVQAQSVDLRLFGSMLGTSWGCCIATAFLLYDLGLLAMAPAASLSATWMFTRLRPEYASACPWMDRLARKRKLRAREMQLAHEVGLVSGTEVVDEETHVV